MGRTLFLAVCIAAMLAATQSFAEPAKTPDIRPGALFTIISLADIGFANGFRFANLGGRRDVYVPLPDGADLAATELSLTIEDVTAYDAKRNLEVLVNDRSAAAIPLDGKSSTRRLRVGLNRAQPRQGFLKLTFLYSGAASQDRCVDVRSIGDSLSVRPESALRVEIPPGALDVATIAALLPRDVAIVLHERRLASADVAAALTIARKMKSSGRRVQFHRGFQTLPELVRREDARQFSRGLILIGGLDDVGNFLDMPIATLAGPPPPPGAIAAIRIGGLPALLVADSVQAQASRLLANPGLAATRGNTLALVGPMAALPTASDAVSFEALGLTPAQVDAYGRGELSFAVPARALPEGMRPARLALDVMVAPDSGGEKAVINVFVNERLIGSALAAEQPTHLDLQLPPGLVGAVANIRVVVQRRLNNGDCRFEPQSYPVQVLGSSAIMLEDVGERVQDFSDLAAFWANGLEILLPRSALEQSPAPLSMLADILADLSAEDAPIAVNFTDEQTTPIPGASFILLGATPPESTAPRVQFDRGRVVISDRTGRALLDLGLQAGGAVMQIAETERYAGLWIKPLAADNVLPAPPQLRLDRGDVAFVDGKGLAFAISTTRDAVLRINYPDQTSWIAVAERFRTWLIGGLWLFATVMLLFSLQRIARRRAAGSDE